MCLNSSHLCWETRPEKLMILVLFLANLGLSLCLDCSSANFSDVPSRVVLADVIFQGRLIETPSEMEGKLNSRAWKVGFTVGDVFKGDLKHALNNVNRTFVVGDQSTRTLGKINTIRINTMTNGAEPRSGLVYVRFTDETRKCLPAMKVGQKYVVFLNGSYVEAGVGSEFVYWASGQLEVQSAKVIRQVKKYSCQHCAQHPKAALSATKTFWMAGDKIRMKCIVDGAPPPLVTWYKNGEVIRTRERLEITSRKLSSLLLIHKAEESDGGVYLCSASNTLGNASSLPNSISVESASMAIQNDESFPACSDSDFCLNGGTCYERGNGGKICKCPSGYSGNRCEQGAAKIGGIDDILIIVCIFLVLLLIATTFAILYCLVKLRHDFNRHMKRYFTLIDGRRTNERFGSYDPCGKRSPRLMESLELLLPDERNSKGMDQAEDAPEPKVEPLANKSISPVAAAVDPSPFHDTRASSHHPEVHESPVAAAAEQFDNIIPSEHLPERARPKEELPVVRSPLSHPLNQSPPSTVRGRPGATESSSPRSVGEPEVKAINDLPSGSVLPGAGGERKNAAGSAPKVGNGGKGGRMGDVQVRPGVDDGRLKETSFDDVNALLVELGLCDEHGRTTSGNN